MANYLQDRQATSKMQQWQRDIDQAMGDVRNARSHAASAMRQYQDFRDITDSDSQRDTGTAAATYLLGREAEVLSDIAELVKIWSAGTGQTVAEILAKVEEATK